MASAPPLGYNSQWGSGYGTNPGNETYAHHPHPHSHSHTPYSPSPASSVSSISSDSSGFPYGSPGPLGYPQSMAPPPVVAAASYHSESPPPASYPADSSENVSGSPTEELQLGHVPSGHHSHQTISAGAKEGFGHKLWHKLHHATHVTAAFRSTESQ